MSLINKMLTDLESRDAVFSDNQDLMLDGLSSAYDIEIERQPDSRRYYYIILVIVLLIATVYAANKSSWPFTIESNSALSGTIIQPPPEEVLPASNSLIADTPDSAGIQPIDEYRISLRLDELLSSYGVDSSGTVDNKNEKLIEQIDIHSAGEQTVLSLSMSVDAHYSVYTLKEPDRVVLQINDIEYAEALPALEKHPQITNIRKRQDEYGNFIFVLESASPFSIVNSGYQQTGDNYILQVTLLPEQSQSIASNHSLKLAEPEVSDPVNEAVTKGELVKTLHQPHPVNPVDKMLSEGLSLYESGQVTEGLDKLYATVKSDASHVRARATLAVILVEQMKSELAISLLEDGLRQYPEQSAWSRLLARIHMDAGNLVLAREALSRNVPAIASDPDYHALYAAVLQKLAVHIDAAMIYRNLVNVQPDNGLWWMGLAISLEAISRNKDALFAYRNALNGQSLTPETHRYIVERIRYLDNQGRNESS